jgi:hypothetical protein
VYYLVETEYNVLTASVEYRNPKMGHSKPVSGTISSLAHHLSLLDTPSQPMALFFLSNGSSNYNI